MFLEALPSRDSCLFCLLSLVPDSLHPPLKSNISLFVFMHDSVETCNRSKYVRYKTHPPYCNQNGHWWSYDLLLQECLYLGYPSSLSWCLHHHKWWKDRIHFCYRYLLSWPDHSLFRVELVFHSWPSTVDFILVLCDFSPRNSKIPLLSIVLWSLDRICWLIGDIDMFTGQKILYYRNVMTLACFMNWLLLISRSLALSLNSLVFFYTMITTRLVTKCSTFDNESNFPFSFLKWVMSIRPGSKPGLKCLSFSYYPSMEWQEWVTMTKQTNHSL